MTGNQTDIPVSPRYLNNTALTSSTYNSEGYYRTGDLAHFCGNKLIIDGRSYTDSKYYKSCNLFTLICIQLTVFFTSYSVQRAETLGSGG